ncbi:uncharacterized protein LOC125940121 [Dermacentor silvarum]|uniref:uncharacterized protein LOC125940121 n=1 Tax=Dermacentor silvarum TaxID=543639 RepID=UPI0021010D7C|nr:uncharacterized protein LOC125940121 [Dermacentor silvarum]
MFKELLAKTAPNARRLDRRKNTPQPRHLGRSTLKAVGGSHRTLQKSPLAARKAPNEFSSWRPPNRSAQRTPRKTGAAPVPVMSPPAKTPANLHGRPSRRSAQREFENTSRYKLPVWPSSPEDHRRTLHSGRTRDDVPRDVHGFYEAAECDVSDGSHRSFPLPAHVCPRRAPWHSPLGREDRHDHLSSIVSPLPRGYKVAHKYRHGAPSVNEVSHDEELFIPPRGARSSPGVRNRPGAIQMFRRFDSTTAWVTDEYSKHKQQGPGYYGSPNA